MEGAYSRLLQEAKKKLEVRGFRRVEFIDRGLRAWFVVDLEPTRVGLKYHGIYTSASSDVGRLPLAQAEAFVYGPVPKEQVCLRRVTREPMPETPLAVRLDTSWLYDDIFFGHLAWLLRCSVDARKAYEQGVESLRVWTPPPFNAADAAALFAGRRVS